MDDLSLKIIEDQQDTFNAMLDEELNEPVGDASTDDGWCQLTPQQMENELMETPTKVIRTLIQGGANVNENE